MMENLEVVEMLLILFSSLFMGAGLTVLGVYVGYKVFNPQSFSSQQKRNKAQLMADIDRHQKALQNLKQYKAYKTNYSNPYEGVYNRTEVEREEEQEKTDKEKERLQKELYRLRTLSEIQEKKKYKAEQKKEAERRAREPKPGVGMPDEE